MKIPSKGVHFKAANDRCNKENLGLPTGPFHAGIDYSYGNLARDTTNNENASQLVVEMVPGLDLILVSHDHQG
ncbi:MAG TPA: hypothetical protein PLQ30_06225, partial [Rectinema sp.]|jgi:hypothetical protein|nr:hypothetical protein [Spirochaetia bacterium]HPG90961.1 hypothetical protein [Rectinema sp.]HPN92410.1 hypothetical protein [Rectinema sp.]HPW02078.1 hypothetical protein [Rectinema sp.]